MFSLLELNIGAPRRLDQPLSHPPPVFEEEAARVISLLEVWLLANMKTLKFVFRPIKVITYF